MRHYITLVLFLFAISLQAQATFSDDFEAYTDGAFLAASNSKWTTWSKMPGSAEDAKLSKEFAKSGVLSLKIINTVAAGGSTDLVLPFGGLYNKGKFVYRMSMYVPAGKNAYFNFQATQTIGQTWAMDANFNEDGSFVISRSSAPMLTTKFPHDKWFDLEIDINLTANIWKVNIDGVCQGAWDNGTNSVASIDLFPINSKSLFYVDDVSYDYTATVSSLALDAGISNLTWNQGKLAGSKDKPTASLKNNGNLNLTSVELNIDVNGTSSKNNITNLTLAKGQSKVIELPELTLIPGENNFTVTLSKINAKTSDDEGCNNKVNFLQNATVAAPNKAVLVEEGTGTWCQWCPRGAVFMDRYNNYYKDLFIPIAVHNRSTDPMLVAEYDAFLRFSGFPNAKVNRATVVDPSATEGPFLNEISLPALATIKPDLKFNDTTKELEVTTEVEFLENASGEFFVTLVLTEDDVRGTTSGYNQSNAYANNASGVMGGYELLPNPVPASKMVYDHVARAVQGLTSNATNSFAGSYTKGEKISVNFTFTLNSTWKTENMHVIPILFNAGDYVNASTSPMSNLISSTDSKILSPNQVKIYPNPAVSFTQLEISLTAPSPVEVSILTISGINIVNKKYGVLQGDHILPVNLATLESGVYLIQTTTNQGSNFKKIVVK